MKEKSSITVKGINVRTFKIENEDYISLTDIARNKNADEPKDVVKNWMRSKATIEFLGLWEQLNNPDFKGVEFDSFMLEAGSNAFTLSFSSAGFVILRNTQYPGFVIHLTKPYDYAQTISHLKCNFYLSSSQIPCNKIKNSPSKLIKPIF